jgi:hypothetical protein
MAGALSSIIKIFWSDLPWGHRLPPVFVIRNRIRLHGLVATISLSGQDRPVSCERMETFKYACWCKLEFERVDLE